jgi:protein O-mannosyl-transferase
MFGHRPRHPESHPRWEADNSQVAEKPLLGTPLRVIQDDGHMDGSPNTIGNSAGTLPAGDSDWRIRDYLLAAVLCVSTFIAYVPSLSGQLIWDDDWYVTKPSLRSLQGLWRIWAEPGATEQYYPLLHSIFWFQHRLWGDSPLGYHWVTIFAHVASALLFACVLKRLSIPGAWLAAMIFALHPVHVESVAWITEQKNTLSMICFLAAACGYFRYDETRRPADYIAASIWFFLSLLLKTVTVTLPAAIIVVLWWKRGKLRWERDFFPLLPWLAMGAAAGLFSSWVERRFIGAQGGAFELSFPSRILVAGHATWFYLGHLAWPSGLNFIYPRWKIDTGSIGQWLYPLASVGLIAGLWAIRNRSRAPLAAYLIFVGTLFPVLGFVNLYGALFSYVWDHWQYLSDIAPIAMASSALVVGWGRLPAGARTAGPYLASLLGLLLASLTWVHCGDFHDKEILYKSTLERNPTSWMAENNLAIYLKDSGRVPESIVHYENALNLGPDRPEIIRNNLGIALAGLGRIPEAKEEYEAALRIRPDFADAESNLAIAMMKSGDIAEGIAHFEAALRLKPEREDIRGYLARALAASGRLPEAIELWRAGLLLGPKSPAVIHYNIGMALSQSGNIPGAIDELQQAVRLNPDYAEAQNDLGISLANSGRVAEAVTCFRAVARLKPDVADAHSNLAEALQAIGLADEAASEFQKARRLGAAPAGQ